MVIIVVGNYNHISCSGRSEGGRSPVMVGGACGCVVLLSAGNQRQVVVGDVLGRQA